MPAKKSVVGFAIAASAVAFNSMGTGPSVSSIGGGTRKNQDGADEPEIVDLMGAGDIVIKMTVASGTGVPAIAANNIVITLPVGVNPRKVFLSGGQAAPKFHVESIVNNVITIGTKVAPAVSTAFPFDLICVM